MLQDEFGTVTETLFLQVFHLVQELLLEDELLYIERTLEKRFGRPQVKIKHAQTTKYEIEGNFRNCINFYAVFSLLSNNYFVR
ncbi:hypothetical protein [Lysinibacillus fusiformis]|uniref:hypothetical protein n=1 Tax=Lysinibacillus fusiformis TaxID=28031 RepID=UPI0018823BAD|nr:hypothetical protein [Lysinibacillus fusiformis]MBD8521054.1 hypothetical protein [Lysinibacillus fusiformis]